MIKVKDGYAKLIGTAYSGSADRLLLSNGGDKAVSDFAASSHKHSASDITSGTLSVARGGTGATSFTSGAALIGNGTGAVSTRSITSSATSGSTALITSGGVYNALTAKMNASITSIELNSSGSLASYGGFIDFHFHDSNKKPLNDAGTIVSSTPDYTSRIIEDAAGTLSVNGVKFKGNKVTASGGFVGNLTGNVTGNVSGSSGSCTGNAASATNADKLDNIDSTGFLRYYNSSSAPSNVDVINTPSYVWTVSTTGGTVTTATKPSGMDNAWGVIHLHTHPGNYATQLGFGGTTGRMYMRNAYNTSTFGNWKALAFTSDIPTSLPANGGNADTVDNLHAADLVKFYLSPMTSNAPADSAKSWFKDTMPAASGAIVYNVPGSEKTIIAGKSSGAYGHMLQLNYDDTYLRILRYAAGTWKSTDWEKISAGYADKASYLHYAYIGGGTSDTHDSVLKAYFNSKKASIPRDSLLGMYSGAYGNGSYYMGYFLSGYDSAPYGGFFVAHYNNPYYVGISNGSYTTQALLTSTNYTNYTVQKDGTGASGTWGINITGNSATATIATRLSLGGVTNDIKYGDYAGIIQSSSNGPETGSWHNSIKILHNNSAGYYTQLAHNFTGTNGLWHRRCNNGTVSNWIRIVDSSNYASVITGTLGIKISKEGGSYSWYNFQQYNASDANPSYYKSDCAIININKYTGWQPWIRAVDSENSSWAIGQYTTNFHIAYINKANTTNTTTHLWSFQKDGTTVLPGAIKLNKLLIPTSSGGTTYGAGTSGQVLKSNGTTVYWASDSNSNTWRAIQVNGTQIAATGTGTYAVNFKSGTGITVSGTAGSSSAANAVTITNAGVRATTINGNYLRVNTNGTNKDLTIPYATSAGSATTAGSANWLNTNDKLTYGASGLNYFNINGTAGNTKANNTPTSAWYHIIRMNHGNSGGYLADIAVPLNDVDGVWWRQIRYGSFYGWYKILDSNNYDDYVNTTNFPGLNKTGTVTSVATGTGLTGGTITSSGTISINSTYQTYISNGNTAYRWGNHASAKYMKAVGRHSGSMNLNKVDSTMSVITEIRPSEITTTNLPSDYGTSYGCLISARDGNSTYGHGKMQILGCDKKFWMRATQGAGEENDGTWCRLALTSDLPTKTSQLTNDSGYITSYNNYYHTRVYSSGLKISTGTGVSDMYVPTGTTSTLGVVKQHTAANCTSYTSDEGATTPAAVKKAVGLFAVTKVSTGTGLTGGDITSTGTISINSTYRTYISNGNTAYGWGNHANAGYIKSTSILKGWSDTRSAATKPNDYNGAFKVIGIKSAGTTLGLTSTQAGSYATIIGWRGWSDSSGGYAWEIASTDKNRLYVRSGSTTSWNNGWQAIAYTSDIPTKTSQLTNDSGYLTSLPSHNHDGRYAWGNYASQSELSDCNNVSSTGFWTHSGFTNRPTDVKDWGSLMNIRLYNSNNNYHRQLFFDCYGSDYVWTRSDVGGTWTSWKRLALASEIPSVGNGTVTINQAGASKGSFTLNQSTAATINLTDTNYYHTPSYSSGLSIASGTGVNAMYVPNAGASQSGVVSTGAQTFAGEKTFSSIRLRSTSTTNYGGYLYFGDGSHSYITEPSDDAMTIYSSKGVTISTSNSTTGTINLKSALSNRTSASTSYPGVVCDGMYLKSALYHIGSVYKLQSSTAISVSYGYGISGVTITSSKPREGKCTITVTNNSGFSIYVHTPHLVSLFTDAGGGSCFEHGFAYIQTGVTFPKSVSSGSTLSFSVIYGYMHTQRSWNTNDFTKSNDGGGFNCGVYVSRYV